MNAISYSAAQFMVMCFENNKKSKVITTQIFEDEVEMNGQKMDRQIVIASKRHDAGVKTSFKILVGTPDAMVTKVCINDVEGIVTLDDKLGVTSDACMLMVDLCPDEVPAPEVAAPEPEVVATPSL